MPNMKTLARPYANAVFDHALAAGQLTQWSIILNKLALMILDPGARNFIAHPAVAEHQKIALLMALFTTAESKAPATLFNFVTLLVQNKRLLLLPDIYILFEALRAEQEKTVKVKVISFSALTAEQQQKMVKALMQRLQRQVTLTVEIDQSLLGGAIIHAGDLVIDGSVRGKLNKLGTRLAA